MVLTRNCVFLTCSALLGTCWVLYLVYPLGYVTNMHRAVKSRMSMVSLRSLLRSGPANSSSVSDAMVCKFPELLLDDPSLAPYIKTHKPLKCASSKNWVYTKGGRIFLDRSAGSFIDNAKCTIRDVFRKNDEHWDWSPHKQLVSGMELQHEAYLVYCNASSRTFQDLQLGVPQKKELLATPPRKGPVVESLNILIYLMDSMSRINSERKMPKLYDALQNKMGALIMEGFNIVGDGTPWTMIPMLTGHFQTELYEARKRFSNSSTVDKWPLLFHDLKAANYVSSYAEEQPQFSFFSYKLRGFAEPPVQHYLRPFEQAINHVRSKHRAYCLGDTPRSLVLNRWWKDMQDTYRPLNIKTFSLLFSSETSHDDYNLVQTMDEHWTKEFTTQYEEGYFNDTFALIMGDHGRRFGPVRKTQSGKLEEKLPFLALLVPKVFQETYPNCYQNLRTNQKRLVTPFDLYETLKLLVHGVDGVDCNITRNRISRGISLFQEIPTSRSCAQASIKPHFCSCLSWVDLSPNDSVALKAALHVMSTFNSELEAAKGLCAPLNVSKVLWAKKFTPNKDVLAFKESKDYDNMYPDLSSSSAVESDLYQLRLLTSPNDGEFEVSVTYFERSQTFQFLLEDMSRLNSYSDQPHCIMDSLPQLRPFCICTDKVGKAKASLVDKVDS